MSRTPHNQHTQSNHHGSNGHSSAQSPRVDNRPKVNGNTLPSLGLDVGPPFLPPLLFGSDDATLVGGLDLGDMLGGSEKENKDDTSSQHGSSKDVELVNGQDRSSFRMSISRADARLSTSNLSTSNLSAIDKSSFADGVKGSPVGSPSLSSVTTNSTGRRISDRFLNPTPQSPATSEPPEVSQPILHHRQSLLSRLFLN